MNDAEYAEVERLFAELRGREPGARAAAIEQIESAEVREMLASLLRHHDAAPDFLGAEATLPWDRFEELSPPDRPLRIGPFQLVRPIATGGMGLVYEALQEQPRRTVALKLLRLAVATAQGKARFRHEIEILGRLQHPHVAQIYEASVHEEPGGLEIPYFVMEYVPGASSLTEYADRERLDEAARLRLFRPICDAVHHGHLRGIIHRDLKPANLLVDADGIPKVIDFGVARVTDTDLAFTTMGTQTGEWIGTLRYMSPEQCSPDTSDLDLRTDVYSLGVVLYELLTEQLPYDFPSTSPIASAMAIREWAPVPPSRRCSELPRDLDAIVLKAIAKEPAQRYQSAAELGADLDRFLRGEAPQARVPSGLQNLRSWARRHRAIALAAAVAVLALLSGTVLATVGLVHAREQEALARQEAELAEAAAAGEAAAARRAEAMRREAGRERDEAEAVTAYLEGLIQSASPFESQQGVTLHELLERSEGLFAQTLAQQPAVEARLRETVGRAFLLLGDMTEAGPHLRRSLELRRAEAEVDDGALVRALLSFAQWGLELGQYAEAEQSLSEARRRLEEAQLDDGVEYAEATHLMAHLLLRRGELEDSLDHFDEAYDVYSTTAGDHASEAASSLMGKGSALNILGRYEESLDAHQEAYELEVQAHGEDSSWAVQAGAHLIDLRRLNGEPEAAVAWGRECLERAERRLGPRHFVTALVLNNLAKALLSEGPSPEAVELLERCVAIDEEIGGGGQARAITLANLAEAYGFLGRYDDASGSLERALDELHRSVGEDHHLCGRVLASLSELDAALGRWTRAVERIDRAVEILEATVGPEHPNTAFARNVRQRIESALPAADPGDGEG